MTRESQTSQSQDSIASTNAKDAAMDTQSSRRSFLKTAGVATLSAPYVITSSALGNANRSPASDRIVMGGIGIGNMGRGDQGAFLGRGDVQYVAA